MFHQQVNRGFAALTLTAALAGAAGCAGEGTTPTAPATALAAPGKTTAPTGATILGTVVGVSSPSSVSAQAISLSVTVTGSSSSSTVDNNGHFTLTGVPAGHVDLHFTGPGVDAHLGLDGVPEHATIVITVRVTGSDAHLEDRQGDEDDDDDDDGEAELSGAIASGSFSGSCAGHNLSFMIGTTKVTTNTSTKFSDGTCESLKAGSHVEVKGTTLTDGSVLATSVEGDDEDENEDPEDEVELEGAIVAGSIGGTCSTNSLSFKVGSTTVRTNAATEFKDVSCASLKAGDSVEVEGARQPDASVIASRVKLEKQTRSFPPTLAQLTRELRRDSPKRRRREGGLIQQA